MSTSGSDASSPWTVAPVARACTRASPEPQATSSSVVSGPTPVCRWMAVITAVA